jgi:hypothetical protein
MAMVYDADQLHTLIRAARLMPADALYRFALRCPDFRRLISRLVTIGGQLRANGLHRVPVYPSDDSCSVRVRYLDLLLRIDALSRTDSGSVRLLSRDGLQFVECPDCGLICPIVCEYHRPSVN